MPVQFSELLTWSCRPGAFRRRRLSQKSNMIIERMQVKSNGNIYFVAKSGYVFVLWQSSII